MKATFYNTVDILVKAYLNDTLKHKRCGCAVHNIITSINGESEPWWCGVFMTSCYPGDIPKRHFTRALYYGDAKEQIDSTGYTLEELSDIEYAFERLRAFNEKGQQVDNIFECLMSVVDELARIHNVDLSVKESAKQLFVKA